VTRIAVSGHRGLSAQVEQQVTLGINHELDHLVPPGSDWVGLSCLADGADQIFASIVLARGGTLEVIIPADEYRDRLPEHVHDSYDQLLARAAVVHRLPHATSTSQAHMDASRLMVDHADRLIAVWDGQPARSYGGTADVVSYAREIGIPVSIVWPEGVTR
jgi:hypothetical protein